MPAQIQQLSTPTYKSRKERDQKKTVTDSPASATPTHMDPSDFTLLGRVHKESAVESTLASKKKKRADESPKPSSNKKSSSKPRSDELEDLDEKWSECFARLEAMLLSKTFAVPVEPVKKPSSVVTSDQPFFDPGTSTSVNSSGMTVEGTGSSLVQTTGEVAVESVAASKSATHPVEGPGTAVLATQPVEASGAGMATQPIEAPGAGPEVLLTGTGNADLYADSDRDLQSKPNSPVDDNCRNVSPDRDHTRDESADQELSEEASYRETIGSVRSFMGWHQIPEFDRVSSADDNSFAGF